MNAMAEQEGEPRTSGVQALIDRLRDQGVAAGQKEAARLTTEARHEAHRIIEDARAEAEQIRASARKDAEAEREAAREAMKLAARDAVLGVRNELGTRFAGHVRRMIGDELSDPEFVRRLILEVVYRVVPERAEGEEVQILLPEGLVSIEELRLKPEEIREGTLAHFVLTAARDLLEKGVELVPGGPGEAGIRVRFAERDLEVDLGERAVGELLLRHLQPRFRALLEGVIR
jgi:V/A-type H+-transporting ATPase subunit E